MFPAGRWSCSCPHGRQSRGLWLGIFLSMLGHSTQAAKVGTRPTMSLRPPSTLPDYGPDDVVMIFYMPMEPHSGEESAYIDDRDTYDFASPWYIFPYIVNIALHAFQERAVINEGPAVYAGYNYHFIFVDSCPKGPGPYTDACGNVYGLRAVSEHFLGDVPHPYPKAILGGGYYGTPVARLMGLLQVPQLGFWQWTEVLNDKDNFPYYTRVNIAQGHTYRLFITLLHYWKYTKAFYWLPDQVNFYPEMKAEMHTMAAGFDIDLDGVDIPDDVIAIYPTAAKEQVWEAFLLRAKATNAHVFFLALTVATPGMELMAWLEMKGLTGAGYLWMNENPYMPFWDQAWTILDLLAHDSPYFNRYPFDGAIFMELTTDGQSRADEWHRYSQSFRNRTEDLEEWLQPLMRDWYYDLNPDHSPDAKEELFDGVWLLLWAMNDILLERGPDFSAEEFAAKISSISFTGVSGDIVFDSAGERVANLAIMQMQPACLADGVRMPDVIGLQGTPVLARGQEVRVGTYEPDTMVLTWTPGVRFVFADCTMDTFPPDQDLDCAPGSIYRRRQGVCEMCPAGRFSPGGELECRTCTVGTFSSGANSSTCSACTPGRVGATVGATACIDCEPGYFQNEVQKSECQPCPAGTKAARTSSDSCELCEAGQFNIAPTLTTCEACEIGRSTYGRGSDSPSACLCPEEFFVFTASETCQGCLEGLECPFGSNIQNIYLDAENLSTLVFPYDSHPLLKPGFWSGKDDPTSIYKCEDTEKCPGGAPGTCGPGLQGRGCAHCDDLWSWDGSKCRRCAARSLATTLLFPTLPVICTPLAMLFLYRIGNTPYAHWRRWKRNLVTFSFLILHHMQLISLLSEANVQLPTKSQDTDSYWSFTVDWLSLVKIECYGYSGITYAMMFQVLGPVLLVCCSTSLFFGSRVLSIILRNPDFMLDWTRLFDSVMAIVFSFFTAISAMSFSLFNCESNPNGTASLKGDYSIVCYDDDDWQRLLGVCIAAVLVYCIGSGAVFIWATIRARSHFAVPQFRTQWRFLFIRYRLTTWWWSLEFLAKNVCFNLSLIVSKTGITQVYLMLTVLIVDTFAISFWQPYRSAYGNYVAVMAGFCEVIYGTFVSNFATLTSKGALDATAQLVSLIPFVVGLFCATHALLYKRLKGSQKGLSATGVKLHATAKAFQYLEQDEVEHMMFYLDDPDLLEMRSAVMAMETEVFGIHRDRRLTARKEPLQAMAERRANAKMMKTEDI